MCSRQVGCRQSQPVGVVVDALTHALHRRRVATVADDAVVDIRSAVYGEQIGQVVDLSRRLRIELVAGRIEAHEGVEHRDEAATVIHEPVDRAQHVVLQHARIHQHQHVEALRQTVPEVRDDGNVVRSAQLRHERQPLTILLRRPGCQQRTDQTDFRGA